MSYFEVKTIKNHDYLYLRQSIRIGNRVIHKHIGYFGRVDGVGKIASGQTIAQVKREHISERIKPPIAKPEKPKPKVEPKKRGRKEKVKYETGLAKGKPAKEIKERIIRKKIKKLKKFLRKKKLKEIKKEPEKEFKFFPWD